MPLWVHKSLDLGRDFFFFMPIRHKYSLSGFEVRIFIAYFV